MIKYISLILSSFAFGSSIVSFFSFRNFYNKHKEAIQKSTPLSPVEMMGFFKCPVCDFGVSDYCLDNYCSHCGQVLDWSNFDE